MATTFKSFLSNDIANTRTLLHEAIPITGSIISGTYGDDTVALGSEPHIKTYGHGMFESVYDYPYLSSSANQIFDLTVGYAPTSPLSASTNSQNAKKINVYNQMAQILVGYDVTGSIKEFTIPTNDAKMREVFFVPFSRLLTKDEIKKGSFSFEYGVNGGTSGPIAAFTYDGAMMNKRVKITDLSGSDGYNVDSPAGEYGVLFASTSAGGPTSRLANETLGNEATLPACGLIYYQAGIAVVSGSVFSPAASGGILHNTNADTQQMLASSNRNDGFDFITGSTISLCSDAVRARTHNISFNNTTELNSTIYFCRVNHNDFNYSSNPTYLTGSKLRVKVRAADAPVAYITTVGLYSADNELMAVAKLSEPLRKDPTNELTLRVRLDY
jgi:hypothetical protein